MYIDKIIIVGDNLDEVLNIHINKQALSTIIDNHVRNVSPKFRCDIEIKYQEVIATLSYLPLQNTKKYPNSVCSFCGDICNCEYIKTLTADINGTQTPLWLCFTCHTWQGFNNKGD